MLRCQGHQCWTAADAGLADEGLDDNLTIYAAERGATLVTLDRRFIQRRQRYSIERHVRLRCSEPKAAGLLAEHLGEVLDYLERDHVTVTVSQQGVKADSGWGSPGR